MVSGVVGEFLCRLYPIVCQVSEKFVGRDKGRRFEDVTSEEIYTLAYEQGFQPNPPRLTLDLPTISGNNHQFDASFRHDNIWHLVECKNTKTAAMDYVYYFNAKILDYQYASRTGDGVKGVFLSAVEVPDSAWRYSIAYGLRILDPVSPPLELMMKSCDEDPSLRVALGRYLEKINSLSLNNWDLFDFNTVRMLEEYRYYSSRWRDLCAY